MNPFLVLIGEIDRIGKKDPYMNNKFHFFTMT